MLSQVNYRVPNMRFLRERLTVSTRPRCSPLRAGSLGSAAACPRVSSPRKGPTKEERAPCLLQFLDIAGIPCQQKRKQSFCNYSSKL